jgi:two-component system, NarL family, response regulator LiaR
MIAPGPVRVLIADDHTLFRAALARMLGSDPRFEVVGQAKDGSDAIELALNRRPDVVLMDLQMPRVDGVEATLRILRKAPDIRVLILSAYAVGSALKDALAGGASGYVHKDATPEDMADRILALRSNGKTPNSMDTGVLSDREITVLKLVARGLSNKQIASRLTISDKTVRNHLSRIFKKLRAGNRTEAVMNAMKVGLLAV